MASGDWNGHQTRAAALGTVAFHVASQAVGPGSSSPDRRFKGPLTDTAVVPQGRLPRLVLRWARLSLSGTLLPCSESSPGALGGSTASQQRGKFPARRRGPCPPIAW